MLSAIDADVQLMARVISIAMPGGMAWRAGLGFGRPGTMASRFCGQNTVRCRYWILIALINAAPRPIKVARLPDHGLSAVKWTRPAWLRGTVALADPPWGLWRAGFSRPW